MTRQGFDADGDLAVDSPNDPAAVAILQQALADLGYQIVVDGAYGPNTAEAVRVFKNDQQLALPPGLTQHDGVTGRGTVAALDAIFSVFAMCGSPMSTVTHWAESRLLPRVPMA